MQEALIAAATHWPEDGMPDNPRGWLIQTAARKMTDFYRSEQARRRREETVARQEVSDVEPGSSDDTLKLLFLCCHPALTPASAVALTLRAVGGLTTAEIARAFIVPEATMAQRISRAKQKIADSGLSFHMPSSDEFAARVQSVLQVLYLIFNEGYTSSGGAALHRTDLSGEALRLTRLLRVSLPDNGEVTGLLALMLLTDARRPARTDATGRLVPLAEQDRSRWDRAAITEGIRLVAEAMSRWVIGEYVLQASIAAVHSGAERAEDTEWSQILGLYGLLEKITDHNPMITLNRAVAAAMVHGPEEGLKLLVPLEKPLKGHYRLDAVRGHLHEMLGEADTAVTHYKAAAARTTNEPERQYLITQAAVINKRG